MTIQSTAVAGIFAGGKATVNNLTGGNISAGTYGIIAATFDVTNAVGATISGGTGGITGSGKIDNAGSITATNSGGDAVSGLVTQLFNRSGGTITGGSAGNGVTITADGALVNNEHNATIGGGVNGVLIRGSDGQVISAGTISGGTNGISAGGKATVNNLTGGNISGGTIGIQATTLDVANAVGATISGGTTGITGSGSVRTAGTISGGTNSVIFTGGAGVTNTLTLQTGSKLIGDAVGSAAAGAINNLVLQGSGTANNNFENFNSLEVQNVANWKLNGDATVGAVTLQADANLAINAVLTGTTVTVNPAAQVFGVGTIKGDVVNKGQLSPGPSGGFGTLTVTGNVGFTSGSTLFINAGPTQASKLAVSGMATLAGATVSVQALTGTFAPSTPYNILHANGGLGGNSPAALPSIRPFSSHRSATPRMM